MTLWPVLCFFQSEHQVLFQNLFHLNESFYASLGEKRAFVLCHGRDLVVLKIVGYAEQVTEYYCLEDQTANIWIAPNEPLTSYIPSPVLRNSAIAPAPRDRTISPSFGVSRAAVFTETELQAGNSIIAGRIHFFSDGLGFS